MASKFRFRRSFGNVSSRFRGAIPKHFPLFTGLLDDFGGAAAAYSLRALSRGWLAGDVVEVRPSSGWTPASFTASQVANGELVDYVKRPGAFTNVGYDTLVNNGTGDGFTATTDTESGFASSNTVSGVSSDTVTITFDLSIVSGSPALYLRDNVTQASDIHVFSTSGSKSQELTATGDFDNFVFSEADDNAEWTISNVRFSTADGFVSTWYDQSGEGNDATQGTTTQQPKIVDAGSLVVKNGKPAFLLDGVDDFFTHANIAPISDFQIHFVGTDSGAVTTNRKVLWGMSTNEDFLRMGTVAWNLATNTTTDTGVVNFSPSLVLDVQRLNTFNRVSSTVTSYVDGGNSTSGTNADSMLLSQLFRRGTNATQLWDGLAQELILYNSDESANRVAIETNINAFYSIF